MSKRTYFKATFTALVPENEGREREAAADVVEAIRESIGELSGSDPLIYKPTLVSVEPYTGPDPFPDEEDERTQRLEQALRDLMLAITSPDAFPVELPEGAPMPKLVENPRITAALRRACDALAPEGAVVIREYLHGLTRGTR